MHLADDQEPATAEIGVATGSKRRGTFAFTAQHQLLAALGRETYAFMCLRWEALWLYGELTAAGDQEARRLGRCSAGVVALRLQTAVAEVPLAEPVREELLAWVNAFAAGCELHEDVLRAHPDADCLWSLPADAPDRLTLAGRPDDLLGYAHRFEAIALEGANLRRLVSSAAA